MGSDNHLPRPLKKVGGGVYHKPWMQIGCLYAVGKRIDYQKQIEYILTVEFLFVIWISKKL
jgi:hypothetical protein